METPRTVQTAFRFNPDLVRRMKNRARRQGISINSYVERLIEKDLGAEEDRYEALYRELAKIKLPKTIAPEVEECFTKHKVTFTEEEIKNDERLAYILSK